MSSINHPSLIIVPQVKGRQLKFLVFKVDTGELSAFLPADEVLKTDNFYAANTFVKGFYQNSANTVNEGPTPAVARTPEGAKLL